MKKVIMVHGWDGNPKNSWFPWLRKKLEEKRFEVIIPAMPDSENPKIEPWVSKLNEVAGKIDEDTFLIGHSIGCQTIMRYLQDQPEGSRVGGIIFVAGFFNLEKDIFETKEEEEIAKPWLETPIDAEKIKQMANNIIAIFSDNDPDVALSESEVFKEKLGAKIIIEKGKGHFSDDAGIKELPVVLNELLGMLR
jgi:predicted alpha/beta hydrolase family esterase